MTKIKFASILLLICSFNLLFATESVKRPSREHLIYFKNTPNELNVYKLFGRFDGNTVLILGGIQGDEPGGFLSADLYPNLVLEKGNLIVIPRANFHSIIKNMRGINGDMNRRFDNEKPKDIDDQIVVIIKELMSQSDLFLNLHDGWGFFHPTWVDKQRNPKRFGQSIIADDSIYTTEHDTLHLEKMALKVIEGMNKKIEDKNHIFHFMNTNTLAKNTNFPEQKKSATYFALTNYGIPAFGIESSKNLPSLELKIRYHNYAINEFLKLMDVEPEHPAIIYEPPRLVYMLISTNSNPPQLIDNGKTIYINSGDVIKVKHIESNYTRGLSCDIRGVGRDQDLEKSFRLEKSTSIIARKDNTIIGKIEVEVGNIDYKLMTYIFEVNGKKNALLDNQTLDMKRGDKLKIVNVIQDGARSSDFKVNLKGYVPPSKGINPGEDRNYLIDTSKLHWKKYSIKGEDKIYPVVVLKGDTEVSRAFIHLE